MRFFSGVTTAAQIMEPNPYESPQTDSNPRTARGPTIKTLVGCFASAVAGTIVVGILTAPMGAIDGGSEFYLASGAILGVAVFLYLRHRASAGMNSTPT
jgi:hypothetical protein